MSAPQLFHSILYRFLYLQISRPIAMKKEGIQTRNRKSSATKSSRSRTFDEQSTSGQNATFPIRTGSALDQHHLFSADSTDSPMFDLHMASSNMAAVDIRDQYSYQHQRYDAVEQNNPSYADVTTPAISHAPVSCITPNGSAPYSVNGYMTSSFGRFPVEATNYQHNHMAGFIGRQADSGYHPGTTGIESALWDYRSGTTA